METITHISDYDRIAEAIRYLEDACWSSRIWMTWAPDRDSVPITCSGSSRVGLASAPNDFSSFSPWSTPRSAGRVDNVLDASLDSGLSGPGRWHHLFVTVEAVTPGEFKSGGLGSAHRLCCASKPVWSMFACCHRARRCYSSTRAPMQRSPICACAGRSSLVEDAQATAPVLDQIFPGVGLVEPKPIALLLKGTNFQLKVWQALLHVPPGGVTTYEGVATQIHQPTAARAVGLAVGSNAIAYLIPCHRVIRKTGLVKEYRWGATRKKAILAWEAAQAEGEGMGM